MLTLALLSLLLLPYWAYQYNKKLNSLNISNKDKWSLYWHYTLVFLLATLWNSVVLFGRD